MRSDRAGSIWNVESTSLTGVRAGDSFILRKLYVGSDDETILGTRSALQMKSISLPKWKRIIIDIGFGYGYGCADCIVDAANESRDIIHIALRHCVWGCKAARRCGGKCALAIIGKEIGDSKGDLGDSFKDYFNTAIGIGIGKAIGHSGALQC